MTTRTILFTAAATLASAGCAPGTSGAVVPGPGEPVSRHDLRVIVENNRPTTMRIFAMRSNMRFLVGEVGPRQTGRFRMPAMIFSGRGDLRLLADPWGSTMEQESEPIVLSGGSEVEWRLRPGGGERVLVR